MTDIRRQKAVTFKLRYRLQYTCLKRELEFRVYSTELKKGCFAAVKLQAAPQAAVLCRQESSASLKTGTSVLLITIIVNVANNRYRYANSLRVDKKLVKNNSEVTIQAARSRRGRRRTVPPAQLQNVTTTPPTFVDTRNPQDRARHQSAVTAVRLVPGF